MAEPTKVLAVQQAVTLLEAVKKSAGYQTDLGRKVGRRRKVVGALNATDFPSAAVFFAEGEDVGGWIGARYTDEDILVVECYAKSAAIEDELLRVEADVFEALTTDPQWGGTAQEVRRLRWETDWKEREDSERGVARLYFKVRMDRSPSAP